MNLELIFLHTILWTFVVSSFLSFILPLVAVLQKAHGKNWDKVLDCIPPIGTISTVSILLLLLYEAVG